jgi:hypothetical protein
VIGDGTEDNATWPVAVPSDTPVLANTFAPCFAGVYELSADGEVRVLDDAFDQATRDLAGSERGGLTIDQVHRLIDSVNQRRA